MNHAPSPRRGLRALAQASAAVLAGASCLLATGHIGAGAATLPQALAKFAHCPVDNPAVTLCATATATRTTFTIGSTTLVSTAPAKLQFGLAPDGSGGFTVVAPTDGTPVLQAQPIPVPGGLLGIPGAPSGGPLAVTATPQVVGLPTVNITNLLTALGPGITLPLDVLVSNPLLGQHCTIGSPANPAMLKLTAGTTSPPPPNQPITGAVGTVSSSSRGVITVKQAKLVDNSFAVPGASGCGPFGILNRIVDLQKGLPSAAGHNAAILKDNASLAPAALIKSFVG